MTATGIGANSRSAIAPDRGPDELEASGEERVPADPRHGYDAVFEWLAKSL